MTTSAAALRPERGHLLRYSLWQFRDYVFEKGIGTLIVMLLAGYLSWQVSRNMPSRGPEGEFVFTTIVQQLLGNLIFVGALFATNGIVSDDRKQGFFRFYFAKPVGVVHFYVQKFVVTMVGYLMITVILMALYTYFFRQPVSAEVLAVAGVGFLLYAGIGFLLSTAVRTEWLSLIAVYLGSMLAWMRWEHAGGRLGQVVKLFPPVHASALGELERQAAAGVPLDMNLVLWVGGYGLLCFVLAIVALRMRPLAGGA